MRRRIHSASQNLPYLFATKPYNQKLAANPVKIGLDYLIKNIVLHLKTTHRGAAKRPEFIRLLALRTYKIFAVRLTFYRIY